MRGPTLTQQLHELKVTEADREVLMELEAVLVTSYLGQYSQLLHRPKTGDRDEVKLPDKWREIRKKETIRVYEERACSKAEVSRIPSLLLLGTAIGSLDDVMNGVVAATDTDQRIKERVLRDGVEQSKMLQCLVSPTEHDPARHVSIKWQLYSTRDYVCLDATGLTQSPSGERLGYHLSHSVAFDKQLPRFDRHSIDRGKRSVCFFYRQCTPTTVELYARGFFDFEIETTSDPVFSNVALQVIANQWLANARIAQLSQMKKLACRLKQQQGHDDKAAKASKKTPSARCNDCSKSIGFLGSVRACGSCTNAICSRCCVKKLIYTLDAKTDEVVETSKAFCTRCIQETS